MTKSKWSFRRIMGAILTFGMTEVMGESTNGDVVMVDTEEFKHVLENGHITFTKL